MTSSIHSLRSHVVQLYGGDEQFFIRTVGERFHEGLTGGEGGIIVATPNHIRMLLSELRRTGADPDLALLDGRLVVLDTDMALAVFMADGEPDWELFRRAVGPLVHRSRGTAGGRLRVYGELVGELWRAGSYSAALRLETFWSRILDDEEFTLLCGYPIDVFTKEFQPSSVSALLCDHTQLIPSVAQDALEQALAQAIEEKLGPEALSLALPAKSAEWTWTGAIPRAEATILWLRETMAGEADDIVERARELYRLQ